MELPKGINSMEEVEKDFKELGLVDKNGKFISKNKFKKVLNVHEYKQVHGKRGARDTLRIGFVGHPREKMYAVVQKFYGLNKAEFVDEAYKVLLETYNGETCHLRTQRLQIGNTGIPISFRDVRWVEPEKEEEV